MPYFTRHNGGFRRTGSRPGFKAKAMIGAYGGQTRFRRGIARRMGLRSARRGPIAIQPIVVPGFTRRSGFYGGAIGELKFHDLDIDDATIASNGTIVEDSCVVIAQGVTEIQRIGRKCTIRSINWRFNIRLPAGTSSTTTADTVRVLLYLDKQTNGATATVTALLESDDYQSFNNLANKSRFRTLMDRTYDMNTELSGDGTTVDSPRFNFNDTFFKKVNIPIEYDSTTGAITEQRSNNIGVLILSKNGLCTFDSKMRIRFSDN